MCEDESTESRACAEIPAEKVPGGQISRVRFLAFLPRPSIRCGALVALAASGRVQGFKRGFKTLNVPQPLQNACWLVLGGLGKALLQRLNLSAPIVDLCQCGAIAGLTLRQDLIQRVSA